MATISLRVAPFVLALVTLTTASTSFAQQGGADPTTAPTQSADSKMEEARKRYQRGLQLYNENNFEAGRVEFERAYQLAPSFKILYNIGLCYEQLGDYVQAQATLKRFLDLGGSEVTADRRAEVEKELAQIAPRIATAHIKINVDGAEVFVDDVCAIDRKTVTATCGETVGTTRDVLLNPGRRRITLKKTGYLPETQVVTVAGSDNMEITMDLKPLPKGAVAKESNPYVVPTVIGWSVTGAAGITALITGLLANSAADDQDAAVNRLGSTRAQLDDAQDKTRTLATVTDIALITTGVAAAVSTYFTIRAVRWKRGSAETNIQVGAGSVGFGGRF